MPPDLRDTERPHVVIIGAGFGGLAAAMQLGNSAVDVTVIDRRNHNLFQPLLYQVATAALSPADISEPIRRTLGRYTNIKVILATVTGIDATNKSVLLETGEKVTFDRVVVATGSQYNYFGNDEWRAHAPGLKTVHEARLIRQRLLLAFEKAELATNPRKRRELLTSVVIGGGPTGVEMAGAIAELGRFMISRDFRSLDQEDMQVVLIEAGPKILSQFPAELGGYASEILEKAGVKILTDTPVESISSNTVVAGGRHIAAGCIVWGAGVIASPAAAWLGIKTGKDGRVPVEPDLSVADHPDIFVIGDTSRGTCEEQDALPALAQVAKQQGAYVGRLLRGEVRTARAFHFRNRGTAAVIGRNAAVFNFGSWTLKGRVAWLLWAIVHVYLLVSFEKRLLVSLQWVWRYLTGQRGARLIDENADPSVPASTHREET